MSNKNNIIKAINLHGDKFNSDNLGLSGIQEAIEALEEHIDIDGVWMSGVLRVANGVVTNLLYANVWRFLGPLIDLFVQFNAQK